MDDQRGFDATLAAFVLLAALAIIGGGAFYLQSQNEARLAEAQAQAEEARAEALAQAAEARLLAELAERQTGSSSPTMPPADRITEAAAEIEVLIDAWHRAAAEADGETYFGSFTDDAVFIGTDATERWPIAEFEAWAAPHFEGESAWTYTSTERHVSVGELGMTAWFDERLSNAKYGEVRGSGVLERGPDGWRIAQYVMSFPVPNELAPDLIARIAALDDAGPEDSE